ncbi:hypothetical protein [Bradyrhizobium sp. BR 1433]|uniref:hypothetical protein n=1 Tax=Bradyrhizobium sp. BR 1433 TaxID=3447967 RepID=UPI003EE4681A
MTAMASAGAPGASFIQGGVEDANRHGLRLVGINPAEAWHYSAAMIWAADQFLPPHGNSVTAGGNRQTTCAIQTAGRLDAELLARQTGELVGPIQKDA